MKETGSDVSKVRIKLQKIAEDAVRTSREVHNKIEGILIEF